MVQVRWRKSPPSLTSDSPNYVGKVPDVFDRLVGQDRAVAAMRQYALHPVHAYLISGPAGSSLHDTVVSFAAALQCPDHGCGQCEICRLVLSDNDADIHFAERAGLSWRIDELREADRVSRRRPLGSGYQIVVLEDIELTTTGASPSAAALLKSLEEPPVRTIFLLTAEDVPPTLDTIVSRCVEVRLKGLSEVDLEEILCREGANEETAHSAALAANGNLQRARVLVRDPALGERISQWQSVPQRLTGTPASSAAIAAEITQALDLAIAPLQQLQDEEMDHRALDAKEMGQRSVANRKDIEAQFKREQRRFRIEELRFGLNALTNVYRERLIESLDDAQEGESRDQYRVAASLRALDTVAETSRRLSLNIDEGLLLNDLMLSLMEL
jgi:DNA polymerase-3 subunit delta'